MQRAGARRRRATTCDRTSSPTRPTSSASTSSTAARRRSTSRLLLAATLSPSYGIYSGFEHFEATPRHPGSEEYLDSEKYELKRAPRSTGRCSPLVAPPERDPPRASGAAAARRTSRFLRGRERRAARLRQARATRRRCIVRRERSIRTTPRRAIVVVARGARAAARLRGRGPARRRALHVAARAQLRRAGPVSAVGARAAGRSADGAADQAPLRRSERDDPRRARRERARWARSRSGSRPTRCGSRRRPSTRSTCAASTTATPTAQGTSAA